jgi:predicted negative regulator of RcsB-dependent stress response
MIMNEIVVIGFVLVVAGMVGYSIYSSVKDKQVFKAAQVALQRQISDLQKKLADLKR